MITTLSRQGGRRYPQMGATGLVFVGVLPSGGGGVAPVAVTVYEGRRPRARTTYITLEQDDDEVMALLMTTITDEIKRQIQ